MKRNPKTERPVARDSKRTHHAKSTTIIRKRQRAAKRAQQGR